MTPEEFTKRFGFEPNQDDLHRASCTEAGTVGHTVCGVCPEHGLPRFRCGCIALLNIRAPTIEVLHVSLKRTGESEFRVRCPVCEKGSLMVYRSQETGNLLRHDRCTRCAQRFHYMDETIGGEVPEEDEPPW